MSLPVSLAAEVPHGVDVLAVPVAKGPALVGHGQDLDLDQLRARAFEGKVGETVSLTADGATTVVAVGVGAADEVDLDVLRRAGAAVVRAAWKRRSLATTLLDALPGEGDRAGATRAVIEGAGLAAYRFTRYKSDPDPCQLEGLTVVAPDADALVPALERARAVVDAVCLARDLVNEPAGSLNPSDLAARASEAAERVGLGVEIIDEEKAATLGLGGLLGVARGSHEPCRLIKLTYDPPGATRTVALVGKGITFDSGGLSIKGADAMMAMKTDMGGGAAVIGAM
ncbi:MAG: leucyl aminopeptidase, partial [Actinomycetota bacterium]|nr:leucyl aminopeptidase [Actinomycetota bacterium]